jgi:membrane fusion protein, multidrug efflux system
MLNKSLALICVLALALTTANAADAKVPTPVEVKYVAPRRGDITRRITLPAIIRAHQQTTLFAKVGGYLKSIAVDRGDAVEAGAVLAEIEAPELVADLTRHKAEVEVAKIDFERVKEAQTKAPDLVILQSIDNAKGKYEIAKAGLDRIETLIGFCKITAPFAGVVTMRYVDLGAFIPAATSGSAANTAALLTLMDFSRVRVQVAVPEMEAPLIHSGLPNSIVVEQLPGRVYDGVVTRLSYALDEATKTMLVEIDLPNPLRELRPGMFASARLGIEKRTNTLLLPIEGVVIEKGGASVFAVNNNQVQKKPVTLGFQDGKNAEILSGVAADDRIILVGKMALSPGQSVRAVEAQ